MFPTIGDYNQTIQIKGANAFKTLSNLNFVAAKSFPIKVFLFGSGSYAVVFKASEYGSYFAIRCFITAENETINRYKEICDYLKKINTSWKADSQFFENEIIVNENFYPVLKMEWVEGILINQFVTSNIGNENTLNLIQKQLITVCDSLEQNKVGHGDLQCGNIIIKGTSEDFKIKLIDYDGMFVPSLTSKKSIEKGRSEFQHPNRNSSYFSYDIDRFSIWVMLTALEALKFDKSLWKEVMQGGYNTLDNFLFTTIDFKNPNQSSLFNRLQQINSPSLTYYTDKLKWFCTHDVSQVEKPKLFNLSSIGISVPPEHSRYFPDSNNFNQRVDSASDKLTIISNKSEANVLTSAFQKLGKTPLQLDKQNYIGKTLLVSFGTETKQITISNNDNLIEVSFTENNFPTTKILAVKELVITKTEEGPLQNNIAAKYISQIKNDQNESDQNGALNLQNNQLVTGKSKNIKKSSNGVTYAFLFLLFVCIGIILFITYSRLNSTPEDEINNQIVSTSNNNTLTSITDSTNITDSTQEIKQSFHLYHTLNLNENIVEIYKLNKDSSEPISSIHDYIIFRNYDSKLDSLDFNSSIAFVDTSWLSESSEFTNHESVLHDMNNNGLPDLMISTFSYGAHCCFRYIVFEFREKGGGYSILFDSGEGDAGDGLSVVDLDNDTINEIIYYDDLFAYWNTSYASSPMPQLIFEFKDGDYKLSTRLMKMEIVNSDSLNNLALAIQQSNYWPDITFSSYKEFIEYNGDYKGIQYLSTLWRTMLDLSYSGNLNQAHVFLKNSWPSNNTFEEYFWSDFLTQLEKGKYWNIIKDMNTSELRDGVN